MTTATNEQGWVADDGQFGARLALVRQRMGWGNVKEAALACGLPVQSWRGWERDHRLPRDVITVSAKIAEATGCDQLWLAGLPQPPRGSSLIACSVISAGERAARIGTPFSVDDLVRAA